MSDKISLKDVESNAKRLMAEKDYTQSLQNWKYIVEKSKSVSAEVFLNMGKCYFHLDRNEEAIMKFTQIVKAYSNDKRV